MNDSEIHIHEVSLVIDHPAPDTVETAFENKLCEASGTTTPKNSVDELQMIRLWGCDPGSGALNPLNGPGDDTLTIGNGAAWNTSGQVEWISSGVIPCRAQAAPAANNSSFVAQAFWTDWTNLDPDGNPTGYVDPAIASPVSYKAKVVPACGSLGDEELAALSPDKREKRQRLSAIRAARMSGVAAPDFIDREPTGLEHGFLRYDQFPIREAARSFYGFRLVVQGIPLKASRLRVAAHHTEYYFGRDPNRTSCTHPVGPTLGPADAATIPATVGELPVPYFKFPSLRAWSVVIWQEGRRHGHSVMSASPGHPDTVILDPTKDVFVQINFDWRFLQTLAGSFGLYVD